MLAVQFEVDFAVAPFEMFVAAVLVGAGEEILLRTPGLRGLRQTSWTCTLSIDCCIIDLASGGMPGASISTRVTVCCHLPGLMKASFARLAHFARHLADRSIFHLHFGFRIAGRRGRSAAGRQAAASSSAFPHWAARAGAKPDVTIWHRRGNAMELAAPIFRRVGCRSPDFDFLTRPSAGARSHATNRCSTTRAAPRRTAGLCQARSSKPCARPDFAPRPRRTSGTPQAGRRDPARADSPATSTAARGYGRCPAGNAMAVARIIMRLCRPASRPRALNPIARNSGNRIRSQLKQHDVVQAVEELLKLLPSLWRCRLGGAPHAMIGGRDKNEADHDQRGREHHREQAKAPMEIAPSDRDERGLRQQQQQEGAHQDGMHVQHRRKWRPFSGLHGGNLSQRAGNEPRQHDGDEARRREHIDPSIDRMCAWGPGQQILPPFPLDHCSRYGCHDVCPFAARQRRET